jgi:mannose-1-phosphate guanylyltransferase/mannose-6-phosphate isomerase
MSMKTPLESPIPVRPVILCGGSGTRLWPLSRAGFPKQFLCLTGKESLFQQAARRLMALGSRSFTVQPPLVVCNEEHRFLVTEQMREAGLELGAVLLEPVGRNTAPALTLAAVLVVTPADQTLEDAAAAFTAAMRSAVEQAAQGQFVVLGVVPHRPETGYGYIQIDSASHATGPATPVKRFVEKPDAATAQRYLTEGGYYLNAGMFIVRVSVWLKALAHFRPAMAQATQSAWQQHSADGPFVRPGAVEFDAVPSESVDYAVLEHCPGSPFPLTMVPLDAGWSDLGAWDAVWAALPQDAEGNALVGDVLAVKSRNNLAHASSRLVALVGVQDVVVETPDAVLVAHRQHGQDVKHIVQALEQRGRAEHTLHHKVHRPWGWYDSVDEGERFKVKRIQVNPKASLSLQKHHHRAEHWVVVKGTAEITRCSETVLLTENQSTYIPLGEVHRLANPGSIPLEIMEVQTGSYLAENDIVRLSDVYGR